MREDLEICQAVESLLNARSCLAGDRPDLARESLFAALASVLSSLDQLDDGDERK